MLFRSPILTNNNLPLKIYCENIVVTFLNFDFLFFILFFFFSLIFFHPYVLFFFSFFFFSSTHVYLLLPLSSVLILFFYLISKTFSSSLSLSLSLSQRSLAENKGWNLRKLRKIQSIDIKCSKKNRTLT